MDMAKLEDWLSAIPSKYTRKTYKSGIKKFEGFYGKPIENLLTLSDIELGHIIDKFYSWLKQEQGHPQNTCRNLANSPIQYFKYFGKAPKYNKKLGIYRSTISTRDHPVTISEIQKMASVADLREQIILEVYLLGLRVRDVSKLQWKTFAVNSELPIPVMINCVKEETVAQTFINEEFKALLDKYLPTIDKENPYLFQSKNWQGKKRKGIQNLSQRQISNILNDLINRASIQKNGVFAWHTGRKLFLTTATELGVSPWASKLMVGKSIGNSDETYITRTKLKPDFIKISNVLKLFPKAADDDAGKVKNLENTIFELQKRITVLTTTLEVLQKGFGVTEEAVSELLKPLLQKKLLEKTVNAGTGGIGFLQLENVNKMSPQKIVSRYLEITKGKR
jgi:site-specific recombinase XerD